MGSVNGAGLLVRTLSQARVGPVFTLSGNQILPVYEAGLDAGLRFIDGRHESAVAHMADAWGRLTGRPGVCLVTAGPGHTNALTGLATAHFAESPMLLLSGGSLISQEGRGGFQELDQVGAARPLCKAAWQARSADELPALVARAWRTALEGTPGPVHITLPFDVLQATVDEASVAMPDDADLLPTPVRADEDAVEQAVALLASASRPLVLGSPSAWRGAAGTRLRGLLDLSGLPGFTVESPRGLTDPALHGVGARFRDADAVLLVGPQDFAVGFAGPGALGTARLIQVASSSSEIGASRPADVALVGDAETVLGQLAAAAGGRTWQRSGWAGELAAAPQAGRARLAEHEQSDASPIHPLRLAAAVRGFLDPGDSVALDGGEMGQWARWAVGGGEYMTILNGKFGGIGPAIPFAIAAKVARPARRCVAFLGDGTFGFHGLELDTAVRFNLPLVVVVGNDAGWAAERHRQRAVYGPDRVVAGDLLLTRYDRVAEGLGCHGEFVEQPQELRPALERAFASGRPACVNVAIDSVPSPSLTQ
ncbi:MAG: thiamine pyrophosphate-binding protein [Chloroflexi bacterium]|nr:thiamine pyrophosphate-binding protein [Chloroflexota bacterium]